MKGSASRSFKSLRKFLYLNFELGESRLRSYLGRIYYMLDFGIGVIVTFGFPKLITLLLVSNTGSF